MICQYRFHEAKNPTELKKFMEDKFKRKGFLFPKYIKNLTISFTIKSSIYFTQCEYTKDNITHSFTGHGKSHMMSSNAMFYKIEQQNKNNTSPTEQNQYQNYNCDNIPIDAEDLIRYEQARMKVGKNKTPTQ